MSRATTRRATAHKPNSSERVDAGRTSALDGRAQDARVPGKRPQRTQAVTPQRARTRETMRGFLKSLRNHGVVTLAARAAGVSRRHVYRWREKYPKFARAWGAALVEAADRIEAEAIRRAVSGVDEPVYHGGKLVGTAKRYSDTLLLALLKAKRPHEYGNRLTIQLSQRQDDFLRRLNLSPTEAFEQFLNALAIEAGMNGDERDDQDDA